MSTMHSRIRMVDVISVLLIVSAGLLGRPYHEILPRQSIALNLSKPRFKIHLILQELLTSLSALDPRFPF